ncbi:Vacuolar protein sorting-associated protein 41 [Naganishia albida]|nr:Vacuolar protein sorting-associated protein 41 [Naganishia albida]
MTTPHSASPPPPAPTMVPSGLAETALSAGKVAITLDAESSDSDESEEGDSSPGDPDQTDEEGVDEDNSPVRSSGDRVLGAAVEARTSSITDSSTESEDSDADEDDDSTHDDTEHPATDDGDSSDSESAEEPEDTSAEGETDDSEDDDDGSDEEDEEPSLKYHRLGASTSEILLKDTASALAASSRFLVLGTHNGMVHVLTYDGTRVKSFRPHGASVVDIKICEEDEFVATASVEGRVMINGITSPEKYAADLKRPVKAIAMEPGFARRASRAFVCGGTGGQLVMHEKGWLGHKEHVLASGEGPVYAIQWRGSLIAWANDLGVKVYDTVSQQRITFIDRPAGSPRADLFKCSLFWQDDQTLLIGWADHIKVARISQVPIRNGMSVATAGLTTSSQYVVEVTAIFQVDCMISGICPYEKQDGYLILAYVSPDQYDNEATDDPAEQRRKAANRPELRIISKQGEEMSLDALSLTNYHLYGCNDYVLVPSRRPSEELYLVVSPKDVVCARPRDESDHVAWLVDRKRFAEALERAEALAGRHGHGLDVRAIGVKYITHLFEQEAYAAAAELCPKVLGKDVKAWEDWVFAFVQKQQLPAIIPHLPIKSPQLGRLIYDMVLAHFLANDQSALLRTIKTWPSDIYDVQAVIVAVQGELEAVKSSPTLMECLAELYLIQHQPSKALPYLLRLRRPEVFDFIKEHNLFASVQNQVLLLIDFDQEQERPTDTKGAAPELTYGDEEIATTRHGKAIALLIDHTYSIPIARVVNQLQSRPRYLYMYLDALFRKDPHLTVEYSDRLVELYAEYEYPRLMEYLRASNYYSLEKAYRICQERDFVPEMVFLLGRMGNNKQALMLIIQRLGDVQRAIEFAREQADEDLWEDLLKYSEDNPIFIRGLLENVGSDINPLRLIRRIKDGLEIPGLKPAIIKILHASNLQVSLLEGAGRILNGDAIALGKQLGRAQTGGFYAAGDSCCELCNDYVFKPSNLDLTPLALVYLCHHIVHAQCALLDPTSDLPLRPDPVNSMLFASQVSAQSRGTRRIDVMGRNLGGKLAYAATLRVKEGRCPVCARRADSRSAGE